MRPIQLVLFTPGGQVYTEETMRRELRVAICAAMERIFGGVDVPQACPECGGSLRVVLHPMAPAAWCRCGFVLNLRDAIQRSGGER